MERDHIQVTNILEFEVPKLELCKCHLRPVRMTNRALLENLA